VLGNIFMNATNGPKRQTSDSNWVLCLQPHLLVVIHSRRPAHFLARKKNFKEKNLKRSL
jgi:hypothetical protein